MDCLDLLGSGEVLLAKNTNPKNVSECLLNSHFDLFSVRLTSKNFWNTACRALSSASWVFANTMTSSLMFNTP